MPDKDKGCPHCRPGVVELVSAAMKRAQTDLAAGMYCTHCETAWKVVAEPLTGQAKADFLEQLQAAPDYKEKL
jgi:hypothetical protein